MTLLAILKTTAAVTATLSLAACGTLKKAVPQTFSGMAEITPVVTEHSFGLQCLGSIIDESNLQPILIKVDKIRDRTIPARLNDRSRLSQAGEWLVHTAISKLETERVRSTIGKTDRPRAITITGAWTQDDELLRRSGGLGAIGWVTGKLTLRGRQSYDYIAGDFVTTQRGVVLFSTAIGVVLGSRSVDAKLFVENGDEFAEIGFEGRWADGPQLAQRRIAEAATLIHVANYYKLDYRPCLESGWGDPDTFRDSLASYASMRTRDRNLAVQTRLANLGYSPGSIDGLWGQTSRQALMAYQAANRLPATGKPSAVIFALLNSGARV